MADGSDPKRSGCAPDGVTLDAREVNIDGNQQLGVLELRYSPRCRTVWGRFTPIPAMDHFRPTQVIITVYRPADGAVRPYQNGYVGAVPYFGDMLTTAKGCVAASVDVSTSRQHSNPTRTVCRP